MPGNRQSKITRHFGDIVPLIVDTAMGAGCRSEAFQYANKRRSGVVQPACVSFDLFKNYEDRGNQFKLAGKNL